MKPLFVKYSRERLPKYQIKTMIQQNINGQKEVIKQALNPEANDHIQSIYKNYKSFKVKYPHTQIAICEKRKKSIAIQFVEGETLESKMLKHLADKDLTAFYNLLDQYISYLASYTHQGKIDQQALGQQDELCLVFDTLNVIDEKCMEVANIDINFDNIVVDSNSNFVLIDYEWVLNRPVPIDFIVFRAIYSFHIKHQGYFIDYELESLCKRAGINKEELSEYRDIEKQFQEHVHGTWVHSYEHRYLKARMVLSNLVDKQEIEQKNQEIELLKDEVVSFALSKSWKLTRPFRKVIKLSRELKRLILAIK